MSNLTSVGNDANTSLAFDAQGVGRLRQAMNENSPEALRASAKQFEALFINMMLKSMRQATAASAGETGQEAQIYTSMFDQQISQMMAERGMGLADLMLQQLQSKNLTGDADASTAGNSALNPLWAPGSTASTQTTSLVKDGAEEGGGARASLQPSEQVQAFKQGMQGYATDAARQTGVPAAFILGQAALESGWGRRQIKTSDGTPSYNLFGIKASADWKGPVAEVVTTEYVDGQACKKVARFKAYDSYAEAFRDYAQLLVKNPRYQEVLSQGRTVEGFAQGLQRAGYATDPAYADKLTRIIRRYLLV